MFDPREAKLPVWTRELIATLRQRISILNDPSNPHIKELVELRRQVPLLKARYEAMTELLGCAAKGGHKTAQEIMEIIEQYDLTLTKKEG